MAALRSSTMRDARQPRGHLELPAEGPPVSCGRDCVASRYGRRVPSRTTADHAPFHVVFVCTGNRARSPLAEVFLRAKVDSGAVRVESYGTLELGPAPAMPEAVAAASALGIDLRAHHARSLRGVSLDDADLVVGFELLHIATAVVEAGASRDRTFMLRELVALLEGFGPAAVAGMSDPMTTVARANARRSAQPQASFSLADPYGRSRRRYSEVAGTIDSLTSTLAMKLFAASGYDR